VVGWLEFNAPFQYKYGYIIDEYGIKKLCHRRRMYRSTQLSMFDHTTRGNALSVSERPE